MGTGVEVCHELVRAGRKLVPQGLVGGPSLTAPATLRCSS